MGGLATVGDIATQLRRLLRPGVPARPFLCDGTPVHCDLVIVGINPATTTPFWDYWTESGFDRGAWLEDYLHREGGLRPTRRRIETIVRTVAPIRVLELNVYPYCSPREADLAPELRDTQVFDYVLQLASPRLLFVHGASPRNKLANVLDCELPLETYTSVHHAGRSFDVYASNHLSYQWSDAKVMHLAESFKARLLAPKA